MNINQSLLDDINSGSIINNNDLTTLNSRITNTNNTLTNLDVVQKNGLSRQVDIKNIITTEGDRLNSKKKTIDQAILSQNRIIYFNDNNRKIYAAYLKILIVLTITLAIVWLTRVIKKHVEFIPDSVLDILLIVTVSIGIIIIYNYYIDIRMRNRYNFDEINLDPPTIGNDDSSKNNGELTSGAYGVCIGGDCCKPATNTEAGSTWDDDKGKCVYDPVATTQPPQAFHTMNSVKPIDAFEYTDYSPYK